MIRDHQPDEAVFKSILPEDVVWEPFAAFPPPVRLGVVVGKPAEPAPALFGGSTKAVYRSECAGSPRTGPWQRSGPYQPR